MPFWWSLEQQRGYPQTYPPFPTFLDAWKPPWANYQGGVPAQLPPKHPSGLRMPWLAVKACAIWRWMGRALVWPFSEWSWALVSWSRKAGWVVECLFCWHRDTPWVVFALRIGTGYWIFGNSWKFRTFSGGILKVLSLWDTVRWKIGGQHFLGLSMDMSWGDGNLRNWIF